MVDIEIKLDPGETWGLFLCPKRRSFESYVEIDYKYYLLGV